MGDFLYNSVIKGHKQPKKCAFKSNSWCFASQSLAYLSNIPFDATVLS